MKTAGIICEYNPFHLGHQRQFHLIREQLGQDCNIVCLMSGNYVQRGMPAMWDKFTRAKSALLSGADLVLELPITGVLQSAEGFASTGVEILTKLGCVNYLCFGVEQGDAETFLSLAKKTDDPKVQEAFREHLDSGLSYAAARQQALDDLNGLLSTPNNILALEYCRAILRINSNLKPLTVLRNSDYHAPLPDADAPSATAVRNIFPHGPWKTCVPEEAVTVLESAIQYDLKFGERAVLARLRTIDDFQWEACAHGSEGLWRKAMKASRAMATFEEILNEIKSKRYPMTRIQRLLMCAHLGITEDVLKSPIPYVRILAASKAGQQLIRTAKKQEQIPLINPGETPEHKTYYELEQRTAMLYGLFADPDSSTAGTFEENGRIILK